MKYASELGYAMALAVHKWKPITFEQLAQALHYHATTFNDDHGNGKTMSKAFRLDRHCNGVIYYRVKTRNITGALEILNGLYTPHAMTMNTKEGKLIAFEYIGDGGDGVTMDNLPVDDDGHITSDATGVTAFGENGTQRVKLGTTE